MTIDTKVVLAEIDFVLEQVATGRHDSCYDDMSDLGDERLVEFSILLADTIDRFAPPGSHYKTFAKNSIETMRINGATVCRTELTGTLKSLRTAYERGYLQTVQELVHASLSSDFLEMASHQLHSGYKDPAAMLAGGMLEEHLRKLCVKNGMPVTFTDGKGKIRKKTIESFNQDLYKAAILDQADMQQVTAWGAIRNHADHAEYGKYSKEQIVIMLSLLRFFISKYHA